ncbi:MAG: hypothetical protein Q7U20_04030 [Caulobacter sp.]|nr:hypothetical protein [Caulobacter sp.]
MAALNVGKTGLAFGVLVALAHVAWAALVGVGLAQPVLDYLFLIHFIAPDLQAEPFEPGLAAEMVVVSFVASSAAAALFAVVWNLLGRNGK